MLNVGLVFLISLGSYLVGLWLGSRQEAYWRKRGQDEFQLRMDIQAKYDELILKLIDRRAERRAERAGRAEGPYRASVIPLKLLPPVAKEDDLQSILRRLDEVVVELRRIDRAP